MKCERGFDIAFESSNICLHTGEDKNLIGGLSTFCDYYHLLLYYFAFVNLYVKLLRVGANSPSLCPIISSVTSSGM